MTSSLIGKPFPHVDGSWASRIPANVEEIDAIRGRPFDPVPYLGEYDPKRGSNDGFCGKTQIAEALLVGIALNDQLEPVIGQFGIQKSKHEEVETSFLIKETKVVS